MYKNKAITGNKLFLYFLLLFLVIITACTIRNTGEQEFIITERDLIPEGTAFNSSTGTLYIGSTYKRKIIQINPAGEISDFVLSEMNGIWSPVGMEVDEQHGLLWVNIAHANEVMPLMHPETDRDWMTKVIAIDIKSGAIVKEFNTELSKAFFNDLTILPNGDVYITETINNLVFRIRFGTEKLELFLKPEGFSFLNGITHATNTKLLFVSSTQGVLKVDLESKTYSLLNIENNINAGGIDGLAFVDDYLIGHQSTKVSRFYLNPEKTAITHAELFDSGPEFDSSTTGEIGNGYYYFIVNSQIRSGVDYEKRTIKPMDSLEPVIIRKIKL